jgi:cyclophilin family peptidyl-prolyl cis-trans isomerase
MCIDPAKAYTAKVSTSKGDFTMTLDAKTAPKTVNNFVVLSRYHFYDGVPFHRVVTDFVIQTGDPLGDPPGTGSPGYKFDDELPTSVDAYKPGSVAMANSGANTNGSQWFVWVGPTKLPSPAYSLFGAVTEGYDTTVQAIIKGGAAGGDGAPIDPTTINYVLIGEDGTYPQPPTTPVPTIAGSATSSSISVVPSVSTPASDPNVSSPTSTALSGSAGSEPGVQSSTPGASVSSSAPPVSTP